MKLAKTFVQDQDLDVRECTETLYALIYKNPQTFPEKKVLKFSRNGFQKNTLLASYRRGLKCTLHNIGCDQ